MLLSVLPSDLIKNAPKFWGNLDVDNTGASLLYEKQELWISSDLTRASYKNSLNKIRRADASFDLAGNLALGPISIYTPNDDPPIYQSITTADANLPKERAGAETKLRKFRENVAASQVLFQTCVRNNGTLLFAKQSFYAIAPRDRTDLEAWCIGAFVIIGETFTPARQRNQRTYTWFWIEGAGAEAAQSAADYFSEARNCASP
jgi:hypothetical protein